MCIADITVPHPQVADFVPTADTLCRLAPNVELPMAQAAMYASAACLRHAHALFLEQPNYDIDKHQRQKLVALLTGVRALAETQRQAGNSHWTRAVLLLDNAIEELEV